MRAAFLLTALVLTPGLAAAQADPTDAKVDCSVFTKKPDGTWFLAAQTTIELGESKITIPPGDIVPRMMQFGMADLHSVLEIACRSKKSEPSQGPKSDKESIR